MFFLLYPPEAADIGLVFALRFGWSPGTIDELTSSELRRWWERLQRADRIAAAARPPT